MVFLVLEICVVCGKYFSLIECLLRGRMGGVIWLLRLIIRLENGQFDLALVEGLLHLLLGVESSVIGGAVLFAWPLWSF